MPAFAGMTSECAPTYASLPNFSILQGNPPFARPSALRCAIPLGDESMWRATAGE
jgi:hypothetical protein